MIEEILPVQVRSATMRHDPEDAGMFPEEQAAIARAVDKRRREFGTVRLCARNALADLRVPAAPLLRGERGEPLWPAGVVGSMTHCTGFRAAAVARHSEVLAIGIDAEPNEVLPDGVLDAVASPAEQSSLRTLTALAPEVHWDRLLFSAKESVYKAWFPVARRWLGFEDAHVDIDATTGTFVAHLLVAGPDLAGRPLRGFHGRWLARDGLVATAIAVLPEQY